VFRFRGWVSYVLTYLSVTPHNPFVAGEPNIRLLMQYTIEESAAKLDLRRSTREHALQTMHDNR
jgi:hypothetical protein